MEETKMFSVKEAANLLGVSEYTIRRRIQDGGLEAELPSKKEGYQISEVALNRYAEKHPSSTSPLRKKMLSGVAMAVGATAASGIAVGAAAAPIALSGLLIGGPLGLALAPILAAYTAKPENKESTLANSEEALQKLDSPAVIDKVIERLKIEQEDFDLKISYQELKARQAKTDEEKLEEQEKVLQLRLQKNQVIKDIKDLEIRKALLEQRGQQDENQ